MNENLLINTENHYHKQPANYEYIDLFEQLQLFEY